MRVFVIPAWVLLLSVAVCPAAADIIHLKNGDTIYADQVKQTATSVHYEVGDNSYSIPRDRVASIEAAAPASPGLPSALQVPVYTPETQVGGEQDVLGKIVRGRDIDRGALSTIEAQGDAPRSAIAYYIAAKAEFQEGKYANSQRDFETALKYQPDNPAILTYYAALLVRTGNALDAMHYAERATRLVPDSADAFGVLGYAQFAASRLRDAIGSWKKSLALRPDMTIQQMLTRAEKEVAAEADYSQRETGHFVLRYEGSKSSTKFRDQLLATLEAEYADLSRIFGSEPRASVQVVLYTSQAFFDVTRAPSWSGALNDGTLRIPLQGVDSVTPELTRVLRHELTHSFVNQMTAGRCPDWLNEGLAQLLEPRSIGNRAGSLAVLFKAGREIPLNMLEHGFASLTAQEATLAYDESLGIVEYMYGRYGMADLVEMLRQIGSGQAPEAALRSVLHDDYGSLEEEYRDFMLGRSGQ